MRTSDIVAAVAADSLMASVDVEFSGAYRHRQDRPPRVVFVPTGARTYTQPEKHAGINPRSIRSRQATYDVYIWARGTTGNSNTTDVDAAESLLNDVCAAIHRTLGDFEFVSDRFMGEEDGEQLSNAGVLVVLSLVLRVPVTPPALAEVTVVTSAPTIPGEVTLPITTEMDFPNGHSVSGTPAP